LISITGIHCISKAQQQKLNDKKSNITSTTAPTS